MHPSTPPKFKVLVAHHGASDPSRGTAGNPVSIRSAFELQQVVLANGTGRIAGPIQRQPVPSAGAYQAAIKVLQNTYWDPTVDVPPEFYIKEEVQVFDQYLVAGVDFGAGLGSGGGTVDDIAISLAQAINGIEGVRAVAVTDTVYITSHRLDALMAVGASNDTAVELTGYVFQVLGAAGVVLTTPPIDHKTYYVIKQVKSQSAPIILP